MDKNFSVEAEATSTLVEPKGTVAGTTWEASYYTLGGYGVYSHPLSEKFHLRGRLGVLYKNVQVSSPTESKKEDGFELSYGLGFTVGLGEASRFILEYTVLDTHINNFSAGVQFKL